MLVVVWGSQVLQSKNEQSTKGFTSWRGLFWKFGAVRFLKIGLQEWVDEELDQLENI